jgi:hypothetical protein
MVSYFSSSFFFFFEKAPSFLHLFQSNGLQTAGVWPRAAQCVSCWQGGPRSVCRSRAGCLSRPAETAHVASGSGQRDWLWACRLVYRYSLRRWHNVHGAAATTVAGHWYTAVLMPYPFALFTYFKYASMVFFFLRSRRFIQHRGAKLQSKANKFEILVGA